MSADTATFQFKLMSCTKNLQEKLEQSVAQFNQQAQELEQLKASLLVQQGAIQALSALLQEQDAEQSDED